MKRFVAALALLLTAGAAMAETPAWKLAPSGWDQATHLGWPGLVPVQAIAC